MTCFYFDRVSAAALYLAEKARDQGALVVFEPTSIKEDKQFKKALYACDVLKYSNERTKHVAKFIYESPAQLVIETLGAEGLRYRLRRNGICGKLKLLRAFRVANLKDTAGAGDWCTAGMLDMLSREGEIPLKHVSEKKIVNAIRYGQAMSALNCTFEGARGAMYGLDKKQFDKEVQKILERKRVSSSIVDNFSTKAKKTAQYVCPTCQALAKRRKGRKG
jgi:fructokinase